MTPPRLDRHQQVLREHILPPYSHIGALDVAYLHGSLVNGYTERADLDVMLVWDQPQPPAHREALVARLDERRAGAPFVVDYEDIHLERFVIAGQEYNVAHITRSALNEAIGTVRDGAGLSATQILTPVVVVAGLCYGVLVRDPHGHGQALREQLHPVARRLVEQACRLVALRRSAYLADLHTYVARGDWFMFEATLVDATRVVVQAIFAVHEVYYPGDKWLKQSMRRFGTEPQLIALFEVVTRPGSAQQRIDALEAMMNWVQTHGPSDPGEPVH